MFFVLLFINAFNAYDVGVMKKYPMLNVVSMDNIPNGDEMAVQEAIISSSCGGIEKTNRKPLLWNCKFLMQCFPTSSFDE